MTEGQADCHLCGWVVKCPEPMKEIQDHFHVVHSRWLLDAEERQLRSTGKKMWIIVGPRHAGEGRRT